MKKKWLAGLLSFLLPGVGQFYLRDFLTGFLIIGLIVIFEVLSNTLHSYFILLNLIVWISAVFLALRGAQRINETAKQTS